MSLQRNRGRRVAEMNGLMTSLNDLRDQGRMTWSERARGWVGPLREILGALVASAVWVNRPKAQEAMVFIEIDGESITRPGRDPDEEEDGEG
jgi:hypothetical protein